MAALGRVHHAAVESQRVHKLGVIEVCVVKEAVFDDRVHKVGFLGGDCFKETFIQGAFLKCDVLQSDVGKSDVGKVDVDEVDVVEEAGVEGAGHGPVGGDIGLQEVLLLLQLLDVLRKPDGETVVSADRSIDESQKSLVNECIEP